MGRILANHKDIFTFKNYIFLAMWTLSDNQELTKKKQIDLMSLLLCIQKEVFLIKVRRFFFSGKTNLKNKQYNPVHLYRFFRYNY